MTYPWFLECSACGKTRSADDLPTVCECGGPYLVRYTAAPGPEAKSLLRERRWTMWRYREWLPLADGEAPATLGEGGTPLLAVPRLAARYGLDRKSTRLNSSHLVISYAVFCLKKKKKIKKATTIVSYIRY